MVSSSELPQPLSSTAARMGGLLLVRPLSVAARIASVFRGARVGRSRDAPFGPGPTPNRAARDLPAGVCIVRGALDHGSKGPLIYSRDPASQPRTAWGDRSGTAVAAFAAKGYRPSGVAGLVRLIAMHTCVHGGQSSQLQLKS